MIKFRIIKLKDMNGYSHYEIEEKGIFFWSKILTYDDSSDSYLTMYKPQKFYSIEKAESEIQKIIDGRINLKNHELEEKLFAKQNKCKTSIVKILEFQV